MKTTHKLLACLLCLSAFALCACDDSAFESMNTNSKRSSNADPNYQLTQCEAQIWGFWLWHETTLNYVSPFCQYLMGNWATTTYGGRYAKHPQYVGAIYDYMYVLTLKNLVDIVNRTSNIKQRNLHYIARIFKVYCFGIVTDLYGDVPYFEACRGHFDDNVLPTFDKQQDIYKDFMSELQTAVDSLRASEKMKVKGDIIYDGDILKWKKLANSLHLRYAMRMVKADPTFAKQEVSKALHNPGGLISSAEEEALVKYVYDSFDWATMEYRRNGIALLMKGTGEYPATYICSTFFNQLKDTNDPRLFVYCRTYDETSPNNPFGRHDITEDMLSAPKAKFQPVDPGYFSWERWPSGYWSSKMQKYYAKECRPQVNNFYLRPTSPGVIMTLAETKLLEAEAVARWGSEMSSKTVEQLYEEGVKAAFHHLESYGAEAFKDADINTYIAANNVSADQKDQIEKINMQLWILHFDNPWEGYANWRRVDYPVLKSSTEYGAKCLNSQTIPLRLCYPLFEGTYNKAKYEEVLQRLGGTDDWNKPVWWDQ
jgi:hypothetical protein